jgi:hypothetical protein
LRDGVMQWRLTPFTRPTGYFACSIAAEGHDRRDRAVLTRLYARNSASLTWAATATRSRCAPGAELVDMEFVQFFPIGHHLAPAARRHGSDHVGPRSATSSAAGC